MAALPTVTFSKLTMPTKGTAVVFVNDDLAKGTVTEEINATGNGSIDRASSAADFKGKALSKMSVLTPAGTTLDSLIVIGLGAPAEMTEYDWLRLGGTVMSQISASKAKQATIIGEFPGADATPERLADCVMGLRLAAYRFDTYKTKTKDDEAAKPVKVSFAVEDAAKVRKAAAAANGVADGVLLARDLVNEPANVLGPEEFAKRAVALTELGVEVEVLTEKEMAKLGMRALLGVGQGSDRPSRLAIMKWNGGRKKDKPIAFVGKGVVFDTGGISIKPAGGMEDMKGDMGGAAAVTGLMHALAARKAKANVIGVIGLVENMPDGRAQRPGDIVESMSGQTIEIINTDAEGRLVLADALTYTRQEFKPAFMINLATLTGAVLVALGNHHAGIFSNDDELSERLTQSGLATGEKVWRLPLSPDYDKMIDTKNADMKNTGGRYAGSITAAQFLQRFVEDTPWVHIDVAGTAMGSPQTEINKSWSSGYGVRLLDRLVRDYYEA
ncbi:leucyl aminopeptidase [Coralliovum pocilloporae]|uniref:leucyl aminopeptidase n=1 Tax=Coralliovum pocilloporae TaxID=3066369 RepID=UPI0033078740